MGSCCGWRRRRALFAERLAPPLRRVSAMRDCTLMSSANQICETPLAVAKISATECLISFTNFFVQSLALESANAD
jgi:hypothetical protein